MRLPDLISIVVYLVQLLLAIPCFMVMRPFPGWLQRELHWRTGVAVGVSVLLCCLLWIALIMLITSALYAIRRRR